MKVLISIAFFSVVSFGAVSLEGVGNPVNTLSANGISADVYKEAKLHYGDKVYPVYLSGAGIRKKTVFFVEHKLYVAASYTDLPEGISKDNPLESFNRAKVRVMQLTMTYDLSASRARSAFREGLEANGIRLDAPENKEVKAVLDAIKEPLGAGQTIYILGFSDLAAQPTEMIYAEFGAPISATGSNVAWKFWNVWFGDKVDDEMKVLRTELSTRP